MKNAAFISLFTLLASIGLAQNKSLGVGTSTPNANAALHVESPGNNQGFIMPRLTTTQRTAMSALLAPTDQGLMLYDKDLKTIYIWDGTAWRSTAEVAGGQKLSYPYKDSVTTSPPAGVFDVFALKYSGASNARVMRVESISPTNQSSALSVQQKGRGLAGFFEQFNDTTSSTALYARIKTNKIVANGLAPVAIYGESTGVGALGGAFWNLNPANTYPALYSRTRGTGSAASLEIENAASTAPVLFLTTNGTGKAIETSGAIQAGKFIGKLATPYIDTVTSAPANSNLLRIIYNSTDAMNVGVAHFENLNPNSSYSTLFVRNNGTNSAGYFQSLNTLSNSAALRGITNSVTAGGTAVLGLHTGTGGAAGVFQINNTASSFAGVRALTNGTGQAINATSTSNQNSFAGLFSNTDAANTFPAIQSSTQGTGPGLRVIQNATSLGGGVDAFLNNTTSNATAIAANHSGTGIGVNVNLTNVANTSPALNINHSGTGKAGNFAINNSGNIQEAVVAMTNGLGNAIAGITTGTGGRGGYFGISNATNAQAGLTGETNGTGPAIQANQTNGGLALELMNGGFKLSSAVYAAPSTITSRAALYEINSGGGNVNLPSTGPIGETCWVANATVSPITVNSGPTVVNGTVRQFIRLTGGWQIVN